VGLVRRGVGQAGVVGLLGRRGPAKGGGVSLIEAGPHLEGPSKGIEAGGPRGLGAAGQKPGLMGGPAEEDGGPPLLLRLLP
jgi:hypothetical protein